MLNTLISIAILAASAPQESAPSARIAYADLNLASAAGVAELDRRIDRAVDRACPGLKTLPLAQVQAAKGCRADTLRALQPERIRLIAQARTHDTKLASRD